MQEQEQERAELESARQESARLAGQVERLGRAEAELRDRVREGEEAGRGARLEADRRAGELQTAAVSAVAARQAAERELTACQLRAEAEQTEHSLELERKTAEVVAVRARLKFAEDGLVEGRRENLQLVESVAALETDLINEKHRRENAEKRKIDEITKIKENTIEEIEKVRNERINKERRLKRENEQLDGLIRRQRTVIGELKAQCREVTERFEESYTDWARERRQLQSEAAAAAEQLSQQERQSREQTALQQQLLQQIGQLEAGQARMRGTTVSAITIERAGRVSKLVTH